MVNEKLISYSEFNLREVRRIGLIFFSLVSLHSCLHQSNTPNRDYFPEIIPSKIPSTFKPELIPQHKIIHKGIFSPDLKAFYFTISDQDFQNFDVFVIQKKNGKWDQPVEVFFNSTYDEHGMSFSPDGNSVYFSSTRPTPLDSTNSTWHIWKSEKRKGKWTESVYVDIPNLKGKLVSHPTISKAGTLFFHSSNVDYSEMDIYSSKQVNGEFQDAEKVSIPFHDTIPKCTPFVSPDEDFLIFAAIENQLNLYISFKDALGNWSKTRRLKDTINSFSQGNPYVTPDGKYLFYTIGGEKEKKWKLKWVNIEDELRMK